MGLWRKVKNGLGYIVDFRVDKWLDVELLKKQTNYYLQTTKQLFKIQKPTQAESFVEAAKRLNLSPEALEEQAQRYWFYAIIYLISAIGIFFYAAIIVCLGNWMGFSICSALLIFALTQSYRYHFWYFQIKQQKLGCDFQEWLQFFRNKD
jgi:intracellular multiplication protein IcmV